MGIYISDPRTFAYIPRSHRLDLPDLLINMMQKGERIRCYPHNGYWLDIGRVDDYQQAVQDFSSIASVFYLLSRSDAFVDHRI